MLRFLLTLCFSLNLCPSLVAQELKKAGSIGCAGLKESSGVVKSKRYPDVFWTHGDSGTPARLYAFRADGTALAPKGFIGKDVGIGVTGTRNIDWEDLAMDASGRLIIGDVGNNSHGRRDLCIYRIPEPDPVNDKRTAVAERIPFFYPDQKTFPAKGKDRRFNCEAVFCVGDTIHLVTKHGGGDFNATVYRLDHGPEEKSAKAAVKLGTIEGVGPVTAGALSPDGGQAALLSYGRMFLLSTAGPTGLVGAKPKRIGLPGTAQCEAICYDGAGKILITNERSRMFRLEGSGIR